MRSTADGAGRSDPRRPPVEASKAHLDERRGAARKALAEGLDAGLAVLGLPLPALAREALLDYLALLGKWNAVYNLTAIREPAAMLAQHLLDSLAIVGPLAERGRFRRVVDVGSGGGLPGVVLAIAWPQSAVNLIEPVGKKAAFLRQCAGELQLANVIVHSCRVEELRDPSAIAPDLIVCRAFASLPAFVSSIAGLATPATTVAAMKGAFPNDEVAALPPAWRVAQSVRLAVPQLGAQRHLLLLERSSAAGPPPVPIPAQ